MPDSDRQVEDNFRVFLTRLLGNPGFYMVGILEKWLHRMFRLLST